MRESKFQFPGKTIDPTNPAAIKAMLKKERFYTKANLSLLYNYFFMRKFIQKIIKADTDEIIIISGSNSFPAYAEPFRIPSDLDIITNNQLKAIQVIQDTASSINARNNGFTVSLQNKKTTTNDVIQFKTDVKLYEMSTSFTLDMVPDQEHTEKEKAKLKKIISTDEEFLVPVEAIETMLAKKILSILYKANDKNSPYYRTKDFYDLYMLIKESKVDIKEVDKVFNHEISQLVKANPIYDRYNLANIKRKLPSLTRNFEYMWGKMSNRFEVSPDVDPLTTRKFGLNIIDEMTL